MAPHDDPLQPHAHDPNPEPPSADPAFVLRLPNGRFYKITPERLKELPQTSVANCFIVSTGHGTSGPFTFTGTQLIDLVNRFWQGAWSEIEVYSADGFGNRVRRDEIDRAGVKRPIILAYAQDDKPMTRAAGSVRLIVPSETDDALRQVKWVGEIKIRE